jgi:predicted HTH transcriptional regulator
MVKIENSKTLFILTFKRPNLQIDNYQTRVLGIGKETVEKSSQKSSQKSSLKSSLKIIDLINENNLITIEELSIRLNLTDRAIKKNIAKLKQEGIIKRVGPDKGGHWEIVKK